MGLKDRFPSRLRAALSHERGSRSVATGIDTPHELRKATSEHDQHSIKSDAKPAEIGNPTSTRALFSLDGLWEEAYRSFEEQNPELLDKYESSLVLLSQNSEQDDTGDWTPSQRRDQLHDAIEKQLNELSAGRMRFSVNGKEVVVREQAEKIFNGVLAVKAVVNAAVASCPPAAIAWAGVVVLLPMLGGMFQQDEDAIVGFEFTADLLTQFKFMESKLDLSSLMGADNYSQEMMTSIRRKTAGLYYQIYTYHIKMLVHYSHSTLTRYLQDIANALSSSSWKEMLDNLKDTNEQIQRHFQALNSTQVSSIHHNISQVREEFRLMQISQRDNRRQQVLSGLKFAEKALFDHSINHRQPRCLENTQVAPLQQIRDWCEADESETIFWLHGMAGTGKSTIARTVTSALSSCQWADGSPIKEGTQLVGSFFFRQGDQDTSSTALLVPTLAWALLHALPILEPYILDAIDKHPGIESKLLSVQWEHLILEPLSKLNTTDTPSNKYVVVIDSLDECDDHEQILPMLKLFVKLSSILFLGMKFFISSRPERYINTAFESLPQDCYKKQPLQKIKPGMNDIMAFLTAELATVTAKLHLPFGWPGVENIQKIHTKADGLYVYASTACRFLDDEDFYDSRLEILLVDEEQCGLSEDESLDDGGSDGPQQSPQEKLDQMYGTILRSCIKTRRSKEKKDLLQHFKTIVGTIMLLLRPLSITSLGQLLFGSSTDSTRQVNKVIGPLHSVIDAQAVDAVVPVHLSFRDFLLNKKRCRTAPEFWIDQQVAHRQILDRCLDALVGLRQDICQLKEPGFRAADIPAKEVEKYLPLHVQYACRYWIDHLTALSIEQRIAAGLKDNGRVHTFMLNKFLYWLEALSVMKEVTLSITLLKRLHALVSSTATSNLSAFIQDGLRFVLGYRQIIEQAPLQIYCSALVFCPLESLVRERYSSLIPSWILQPPFTPHEWSPELFVLEGSGEDISGIAWSLNGAYVAGRSRKGHVYVWDTFTGGEICSFHDPRQSDSPSEYFYLEAIALSPDGSMLATPLPSGGTCLRTIATGEVTVMNYNESLVQHLAFSPDGRTLISTEATVWLGRTVGSDEIHAWDTHSKKHLQKYRCNGEDWVPGRVMITDSDSAWIVEERKYSTPKHIRLTHLHLGTGEFTSPISCEVSATQRVLFSPDGSTLATWSDCGSIYDVQVWDATSNALRHNFTIEKTKLSRLGFAPYNIPDVISADGKLVGVIGREQFALMHADQGTEFSGIFAAPSHIDKLAFCPCSSMVASSSRDGNIRIWDTDIHGDHRIIGESIMDDWTVVQFSPRTDMVLVRMYTWQSKCRLWNMTNGPARVIGDITTEIRFLQKDRVLLAPKYQRGRGIQICNENLAVQIGEFQDLEDFVIADNGQLLACIYTEEMQILETEGCQVIARWAAKDVDMVTFSADGTTAAVAETLKCFVHDVQTGKQVFNTSYHRGDREVFDDSIHLSPHGHFLVTFSEAELEVWDVREQLKVLSMSLNYQDESSVIFSPDESYFLLKTGASYYDPPTANLQIWETVGWSKRHTLKQPFCGPIWEYATISSTNLCAAYLTSTPKQVKLWDLASGEEKGSLIVDGHIRNLRFSPDDQRLYCNRGRLSFSNLLSSGADEDLYVSPHWVRQGSRDLIKLPAVYRKVGVAVQGNTISFAQGYDWAEYLRLDISATPGLEILHCQDKDRISDTQEIPARRLEWGSAVGIP